MRQILRKASPPTKCPFCSRDLIRGPGEGLLYCDPCSELAEWFPLHLSYTLTGDPGTGKSLWIYRVLDYYLRIRSPALKCVLLANDEPLSGFREHADASVRSLSEMETQGRLRLVDGHSALGGLRSKEKYSLKTADDLGAMADLFSDFVQEGFQAFFVDSLGPIDSVMDPKDLARGLTKLVARLKGQAATLFLTASMSVWDNNAIQFRDFTDALIEFRRSTSLTTGELNSLGLTRWLQGPSGQFLGRELLREFRFRKARGKAIYPGWIPFVIARDAVFIALPDSPRAIKQIHEECASLSRMSVP